MGKNVRKKTLSSISFFFESIRLCFLAVMVSVKVTASTSMIAKPGCSSMCGNVAIPYPFGLGEQSCSLNQEYHVTCNFTYNPPRPFMRGYHDEALEILSITDSMLRIRNQVATECFDSSGFASSASSSNDSVMYGFLSGTPFSFSYDLNRLTTIGCSVLSDVSALDENGGIYNTDTLCYTTCPRKEEVVGSSCDGVGCCETIFRKGTTLVIVSLLIDNTVLNPLMPNQCAYAFLAEKGTFTFGGSADFSDPNFREKTIEHVPVVVDWVIGNKTCKEAQNQSDGSYACQANTTCSNYAGVIGGYTCSCLPGYQGNPYLSPGCSDIDECAGENNCIYFCTNQPGSYLCSCPIGLEGSGMKGGTGGTDCVKIRSADSKDPLFIFKLALGISLGLFGLVLAAISIYLVRKKLRNIKLKQDCFRKNGGFLLQELVSSTSLGDEDKLKIFTLEELNVATTNFSDKQVLGKGGHGVVYKGVLSNNQVVAIKKSKVVDQDQIEEFINEMVILGQITHNNVVKIVGCCLESEVPMLVYEYVSNGTLFEHIHSNNNDDEQSWLDWSNCTRIAIETAGALAHLHSAVSIPIIHRDVKSANILIDENYNAKISDFGASRLIPLDQTRLSTVVQGTIGYLDPDYFQSGHITEKSDVYSFGIVLIELLTRQKPVLEDVALSTYFIESVQAGMILSILDPKIGEEASTEQLTSLAELILRCLSSKGKDRPKMMHVLVELKAIKARVGHPFALEKQQHYEDNEHGRQAQDDETYSVDMSHGIKAEEEEADLYPVNIT